MKKNYFLIILILILYIGCKEKHSSEVRIIDADYDESTTLKLSDICDSITILPLETKENFLIGKITRILQDSSRLFIKSTYGHVYDRLFTFDENGKFITEISKIGQGPKEVSSIADFCIYKNQLIVFDENGSKILVFNLQGEFLKSKKSYFYPEKVINHNNKIYIYKKTHKEDPYPLVKLDINDNELDTMNCIFSEIELNKKYALSYDVFCSYNDSLFFIKSLNDTIFNLKEDRFEPIYRYSTHQSLIPDNIFVEKKRFSIADPNDYAIENNSFWNIEQFINTDNFLFCTISAGSKNNKQTILRVYVTNKKNNITFVTENVKDDIFFIDNTIDINYKTVAFQKYDNRTLIWPINPSLLLNSTTLNIDKCSSKVKDILSKLKEDDNPVLLFLHLKQ